MPIMLVMMILMLAGIVYAYQGVAMHNQVAVEEVKFHELQSSYWSQSKQVRDAAETGSQLNQDLVQIKNYPSTLLELKLVGVGKILTGIFIVLFAILIALMMMPVRLAQLIKKESK